MTAFVDKRSGDHFDWLIVASEPSLSVDVFELRLWDIAVRHFASAPRLNDSDVITFHSVYLIGVVVCHISSIVYRCDTLGHD